MLTAPFSEFTNLITKPFLLRKLHSFLTDPIKAAAYFRTLTASHSEFYKIVHDQNLTKNWSKIF